MQHLKHIITPLLFLFITPLHAQQKAKAYRSLSDYMAKRAKVLDKVSFKEVKNDWGDIVEGYYKVMAKDKEQNLFIKEKCWALEAKDNLYLNDYILTGGKGYSQVLLRSARYLFFKATLGAGIQNTEGIGANATDVDMAGAVFGATGSAVAGSVASNTIYYHILDLETGRVSVLNKIAMLKVLARNTALKEQYLKENEPELGATYIKYLSLLIKASQ